MKIRISPSMLAADALHLADAVARMEKAGVDLLHIDVMDGHFVPNLGLGTEIVSALARATRIPLDVHLMISDPDRYIDVFVKAGAAMVSVHAEASVHLHRTLTHIRGLGAKAGVALNPATNVSVIDDVIGELDHVLVMSVNPGFSGQKFIPHSVQKVAAVRAKLDSATSHADIEVDGGVDASNAGALVKAGATILVAGSAIFGAPDPEAATRLLTDAAGRGR